MPIYEYICDDCGHEFELIQKMKDEPIKHCPACQHSPLRKLISQSGFRLKGKDYESTGRV